jgi:hypothetical protein
VFSRKIAAAAIGVTLVLTTVVAVGGDAAFASGTTTSVTVDGVDLSVTAANLPQTEFTAANPGDQSQSASASSDSPYASVTITAVPFGYDDPVEDLGAADATSVPTWLNELSSNRVTDEGGTSEGTPSASLFGQSAVGIESRVSLSLDGGAAQSIDIAEWVVNAGSRLWIIRDESAAGGAVFVPDISVVATSDVNAPTTLDDVSDDPIVNVPAAKGGNTSILPTPSWWSGTCDVGNDPGSYRLGTASYRGVVPCGPRHRDRVGSEPVVSIGGHGEFEWECVELVMRYMYQAGYVTHGYPGNGNDIVKNYNGTKMVKEQNGVAGSSPQPGDVVSMGFDTKDGHTAIVIANDVDSNGNGTIEILQQNSSINGLNTMDVSNWKVKATVGNGVTWLHDPTASTQTVVKQKAPNDYNGDGKSDFSLYRPSVVTQVGTTLQVSPGSYLLHTTSGSAITGNGWLDGDFGVQEQIPVSGDYDGDGKSDLALWVASPSSNTAYWDLHTAAGAAITGNGFSWGLPGDIPVPGDYNGDGKTDLATWRPSTGGWYIRTNTGATVAGTGTIFGQAGDIPVPGDYNGDGKTDFAVFRPSTGQWLIETTAGVAITDFASTTGYGHAGDIPVPGDYNGDGVSDIAIYRPLSNGNGEWFLRTTAGGVITGDDTIYGLAGDVPVPGDYNGDGEADLVTWRPSTGAWFMHTTSGSVITGSGGILGQTGDVPMATLPFSAAS